MAEAEYWRFTVARDCQKKNTSETHSEYKLPIIGYGAVILPASLPRARPQETYGNAAKTFV
jgi:hypothetical protein